MDILVEDGTGLVTANALASLDEVDDILSVNPQSKWPLLDDTSRENLVIWATRLIIERVKWNGRKTFPTSGTPFPRCGLRDREGNMIDDNVVPSAVKYAVAVMAEHLMNGNPEVVNTANNLTELQVDVITLKFDATILPNKYPVELNYILSGLGWLSFGRGGPKRIIKH